MSGPLLSDVCTWEGKEGRRNEITTATGSSESVRVACREQIERERDTGPQSQQVCKRRRERDVAGGPGRKERESWDLHGGSDRLGNWVRWAESKEERKPGKCGIISRAMH